MQAVAIRALVAFYGSPFVFDNVRILVLLGFSGLTRKAWSASCVRFSSAKTKTAIRNHEVGTASEHIMQFDQHMFETETTKLDEEATLRA